jgi:hypothetical protein
MHVCDQRPRVSPRSVLYLYHKPSNLEANHEQFLGRGHDIRSDDTCVPRYEAIMVKIHGLSPV